MQNRGLYDEKIKAANKMADESYFSEAIGLYSEAIDLDRNRYEAYFYMAQAMVGIEDDYEAYRYYEDALSCIEEQQNDVNFCNCYDCCKKWQKVKDEIHKEMEGLKPMMNNLNSAVNDYTHHHYPIGHTSHPYGEDSFSGELPYQPIVQKYQSNNASFTRLSMSFVKEFSKIEINSEEKARTEDSTYSDNYQKSFK